MRTKTILLATASFLMSAAVGALALSADRIEPIFVDDAARAHVLDETVAWDRSTRPTRMAAAEAELALGSTPQRSRTPISADRQLASTRGEAIATALGAAQLLDGLDLEPSAIAAAEAILAAERRGRRQILQKFGELEAVDPSDLRSALEDSRTERNTALAKVLGDATATFADREAEAGAPTSNGGTDTARTESKTSDSVLHRVSELRTKSISTATTGQ
ncbi:hypothetical protein Pla163_33370 [Planctomycetes bacterium Pla163]|uniref:Uncharacterized protein n=1 Tax=Rohdeia mirabilis TaxID=2528008 RepID=A0A518D3X9_9BACT|nr:hypothetical protein Pla163_33370 [Planctomycetes bacterium Pla163]